MHVSRLIIDGVRSFANERAIDLDFQRPDGTYPGWTVIAGRNGAGKTTLLRSLVLAIAGPARALQVLPVTQDWINEDSAQADVEVELAYDQVFDRPAAGRLPTRGSMWAGLRWKAPTPEEGVFLGRRIEVRPQELMSRNPKNIRKAAWNGSWGEQPNGWFYAGYGPFRRLMGEGADETRLMLGPLPVARVATLFREGASLAESVQWLKFHHLRRLELREGSAKLVEDVIDLLNDGLLPDGFSVDDVDSEGLWIRNGDRRYPLDEMSDGYRAVNALIIDMIRAMHEGGGASVFTRSADDGRPIIDVPGVVLIDEVEAHLHVSWQRRIGPWMCRHFPNIQFIVTTHSPYVCQAASPNGLIRLAGPGEPQTAEVLDEEEQRRVIHGTGDDAVVSDLFGLESLFTPETLDLRQELAEVEVKVIEGEASPEDEHRYDRLLEELQPSPKARVDILRATL